MNPYTPPEQEPVPETTGTRRLRSKSRNRWITIGAYSCVILGVGLVASLLASIFIPDTHLGSLSSSPSGDHVNLAIGAIVAMLVCPIFAGIRHWGVLNYWIASALTLGLLLGNVGSGITLSLVSLLIVYGTKRLCFLLLYFRS